MASVLKAGNIVTDLYQLLSISYSVYFYWSACILSIQNIAALYC